MLQVRLGSREGGCCRKKRRHADFVVLSRETTGELLKMFECVCVYVYVGVCVCVCMFMWVCMFMCVCLCVYVYVCMFMCVCVYGCVGDGRVYVIVGGNTSLCPSLSHSKVGHAPTVSTSVITGSPNRSAI